MRESPFERIWIQPAAGDAGGALGSALFTWYQLLENPRSVKAPDGQHASLLGPAERAEDIEATLKEKGLVYRKLAGEADLCSLVARYLDEGLVVGWVQGRMEFGPRALGSRSILGDPRKPEMQRKMNLKIKFRESFRPFAPIVIQEKASAFFELKPEEESPYMLIVAPVKQDQRKGDSSVAEGLASINDVRSTIPAVTHVDYSARIQTVDSKRTPRLRALLDAFEERTGCPMLVNTSFNIRGEPIVCTAADASRCFMATEMDVLVVGEFVLLKSEQTYVATDEGSAYKARYGDD